MTTAEIGVIGLGVMGSNLTLNIAEKGFRVAIFNRTNERTREFHAGAGELASRIIPCETLASFTASIRMPRPIILLIKAGDPVDQQIAGLKPYLTAGDTVIDSGNADFRDTQRRLTELVRHGFAFIGMGISGGEEGARHGPSIMAGGDRQSYARVEDILTSVAAKYQGEPCAALVGPDGAGHFVKTIHNGIEYADMQMIAEIYGMLRDGLGLSPARMSDIFVKWNEGPLQSYLIEITAKVLGAVDPDTNKPIVDLILDRAGQKGTGRWSAIEAQRLGIPATTIEAAVAARSLSAIKEERVNAEAAYRIGSSPAGVKKSDGLVGELENALLAGKIAAYAQGFAVMDAASREFDWALPMGMIAKIWRAGCIIRSRFLGDIATAFDTAPVSNLLLAPFFVEAMRGSHMSLRKVVAYAAESGNPAPALAAALSYFDGYRRGRGSANLIQAQRDFFGAHGFERIDRLGEQHGPWSKAD
jgi:6-phosphogluconate dehydrogenase